MPLTSSLKPMASRVIAREGRPVSVYFQDTDVGDYDPATGTNVPSAPTVVATTAVFLDFAILSSGTQAKYGTLIEASDKEVYLSAAVAFPREPNANGDYLVDNEGVKWRIVLVKKYAPANPDVIMYNILVRR